MLRIQDITHNPSIRLKNVKINFEVKLLQYKLNQLLYRYNNKYAFPQYISQLCTEIVQLVKDNEKIAYNKQSIELLSKIRQIYTVLWKNMKQQVTPEAVDNTLKYILYRYSNNKEKMTQLQEIEMYNELLLIKSVIEQNKIPTTQRITNTYKLILQLKEQIIKKLN